jgi:hypothetical protein
MALRRRRSQCLYGAFASGKAGHSGDLGHDTVLPGSAFLYQTGDQSVLLGRVAAIGDGAAREWP